MIHRFRQRPVEVEAVQWTGSNLTEMYLFAATFFHQLPDRDGATPRYAVPTGAVYSTRHSRWLPVLTDEWVVKGPKGEFFPCDDRAMHDLYELLEVQWQG